jgi:hypothetical protein
MPTLAGNGLPAVIFCLLKAFSGRDRLKIPIPGLIFYISKDKFFVLMSDPTKFICYTDKTPRSMCPLINIEKIPQVVVRFVAGIICFSLRTIVSTLS